MWVQQVNTPDTDSLFSATPRLRAQLAQLQTTLSQQMNKPAFLLKPLGMMVRRAVDTVVHVPTCGGLDGAR